MIPRKCCLVIASITCLLAPAVSPASVAYVNSTAPAGGDGTTWATAFRYLDDALTAARVANSGITEIWVAQGTYYVARGPQNPMATYLLVPGVPVYGGFTGLESRREERDANAHVSSIDGRNVYYAVTIGRDSNSYTLDGFKIVNSSTGIYGGNGDSHLVVRNCSFLPEQLFNRFRRQKHPNRTMRLRPDHDI